MNYKLKRTLPNEVIAVAINREVHLKPGRMLLVNADGSGFTQMSESAFNFLYGSGAEIESKAAPSKAAPSKAAPKEPVPGNIRPHKKIFGQAVPPSVAFARHKRPLSIRQTQLLIYVQEHPNSTARELVIPIYAEVGKKEPNNQVSSCTTKLYELMSRGLVQRIRSNTVLPTAKNRPADLAMGLLDDQDRRAACDR